YAVCLLATQAGATNSPFGQAKTITASQSISSISVSPSSFAANSPVGTVVGAVSVGMTGGSFTGTMAMTNTAGNDFCIAPHGSTTCGTNLSLPVDVLVESGGLSGSYTVQITAAQSGAQGSSFAQNIPLTTTSQTISSIALSNNSTTTGLP